METNEILAETNSIILNFNKWPELTMINSIKEIPPEPLLTHKFDEDDNCLVNF